MFRIKFVIVVAMLTVLLCSTELAFASIEKKHDSHYVASGFFDVHVCNWPDRPPFYLLVFSTAHYNDIASVKVMEPNGNVIDSLKLDKYRIITRKGKPEKHVFMDQVPLPKKTADGWFKADIELRDGSHQYAQDEVRHFVLPRASHLLPAGASQNVTLPSTFSWGKVPGAGYYRVFIRDLWDGEKLVYSSKLVKANSLSIPQNILKPGGEYSWRVHARDVNEDRMLGDFNAGSQSDWLEFSVAD